VGKCPDFEVRRGKNFFRGLPMHMYGPICFVIWAVSPLWLMAFESRSGMMVLFWYCQRHIKYFQCKKSSSASSFQYCYCTKKLAQCFCWSRTWCPLELRSPATSVLLLLHAGPILSRRLYFDLNPLEAPEAKRNGTSDPISEERATATFQQQQPPPFLPISSVQMLYTVAWGAYTIYMALYRIPTKGYKGHVSFWRLVVVCYSFCVFVMLLLQMFCYCCVLKTLWRCRRSLLLYYPLKFSFLTCPCFVSWLAARSSFACKECPCDLVTRSV
jgi:hypothetical protein